MCDLDHALRVYGGEQFTEVVGAHIERDRVLVRNRNAVGDPSNRDRCIETSVFEAFGVLFQSTTYEYCVKIYEKGWLYDLRRRELWDVGPYSMFEWQLCPRGTDVDDRGAADPLYRLSLR